MTTQLLQKLSQTSPMFRRVLWGVGAYGYAQLVTVFTQLVTLPVYLAHWNVATYGVWLTLSTVPAYLSLADAGFLTATSNKMIALEAVGKHEESTVVFQSAVLFLACVSIGLIALVSLATWLIGYVQPEWSSFATPLFALTGGVIVSLFITLASAIYTATQGFAVGTFLNTTSRLAEWFGAMAGLFSTGNFAGVAVGMLISKTLFALFMIAHSSRRAPHLRWGVAGASMAEIRSTTRPALLFAVFPLTTALSLQGFVILVTAVLGPAATAVFASYRTLSRLVVQLAAAVSHTMWPEFAHMHSTRSDGRLRHAYDLAYRATTVIGLLSALALLAVAPWIIEHWSHGKIPFSWPLMIAFTVYATAASLWHVQRVMLLSVNAHAMLAKNFLIATVISLGAAWWLAANFGNLGAVASMVVAEIWMWWTSGRAVRQLWRGLPT